MLSNIVVRLLVAVLVYFLGSEIIGTFVTDAQALRIFKIVLLIVCVLIILLGGSLTL